MVDANIPDIKMEPDKAVLKVSLAGLLYFRRGRVELTPISMRTGPGQVPSQLVGGGSDQSVRSVVERDLVLYLGPR